MRRGKQGIVYIALAALVALTAGLSLAIGSRSIPLPEVFGSLLFPSEETSFTARVVQARVPRTVFGLLAGPPSASPAFSCKRSRATPSPTRASWE